MRYETVLNFKEYLHLLFLVCVFFANFIFFNLDDAQQRAWSILIVVSIGLIYTSQINNFKMEYWNWEKEENTTDYEIVGPFGFVLIAAWIALLDVITEDVVSKYTGLIIIFTILSAFAVTVEIKKRTEERLVSELSVIAHKVVVWGFFGFLYLIATRYFLFQGTWDWDLPSLFGVFSDAFR